MIIQGGIHQDPRGKIIHINDFDMELVKRMYHFHQSDVSIIRAWQGHKKEMKWMHCIKGSYAVRIVELDSIDKPSRSLLPKEYTLSSNNSQVLHIPPRHANGFKAIEPNSILIVFSNMNVEDSNSDLIRYDQGYWAGNWNETHNALTS
jgi:dTDP-4-dehydrorhamnose 3,5-epimerase